MRPSLFNIDCELLIAAVKDRPPIWSVGHQHHLNRKVLRKLWTEIGAIFKDVEVLILKRKWKYLKDHFRREVKKCRVKTGDDGDLSEDSESQWPYFQIMKFCMDEFSQRDEASDNYDDFEDRTQDLEEDASLEDPLLMESSSTNWGKRKRQDLDDLDDENRKLKQMLYDRIGNDNDEKCDDYHFFQTLIPLMKKFTDAQKLRVRNRINQVLLEEMEAAEEIIETKYRPSAEYN